MTFASYNCKKSKVCDPYFNTVALVLWYKVLGKLVYYILIKWNYFICNIHRNCLCFQQNWWVNYMTSTREAGYLKYIYLLYTAPWGMTRGMSIGLFTDVSKYHSLKTDFMHPLITIWYFRETKSSFFNFHECTNKHLNKNYTYKHGNLIICIKLIPYMECNYFFDPQLRINIC